MSDAMSAAVWHEGARPPEGMRVTRVHGWVFDDQGHVVLLYDGGKWSLPGGSPEQGDHGSFALTLARECEEEVQVTVHDVTYLGFQEIRHPQGQSEAQVRMVARTAKILERRKDPDHGRIHPRRWCTLCEAAALLGSGAPTQQQIQPQIKAAARLAQGWGLPVTPGEAGPGR
jgi:8-oxo-dGTP diphosphatase